MPTTRTPLHRENLLNTLFAGFVVITVVSSTIAAAPLRPIPAWCTAMLCSDMVSFTMGALAYNKPSLNYYCFACPAAIRKCLHSLRVNTRLFGFQVLRLRRNKQIFFARNSCQTGTELTNEELCEPMTAVIRQNSHIRLSRINGCAFSLYDPIFTLYLLSDIIQSEISTQLQCPSGPVRTSEIFQLACVRDSVVCCASYNGKFSFGWQI